MVTASQCAQLQRRDSSTSIRKGPLSKNTRKLARLRVFFLLERGHLVRLSAKREKYPGNLPKRLSSCARWRTGCPRSNYSGEGVGLGLEVAVANAGPILSSSPSNVPLTFL